MNSIRIVCPGCQTPYRVREEQAGSKVRCKKCQEIILVQTETALEPEEVEEVPVKPRNRAVAVEDQEEEEERPRRRKKSGFRKKPPSRSSLWKILGPAAGVLLLVALSVTWKVAATRLRSPREDGSGTLNHYAPLNAAALPALGPGQHLEAGVVFHEVFLRPGDASSKIWVYLPDPAPARLPCVLIAPAGSTLFFGMNLEEGDRKEHLPYVRAGFAVVAYAIAGPCEEEAPEARVLAAARAFQEADAGLVNARQALDFALARFPAIDPQRLYTAGHSSAATLSLLVAEHEPRIRGCVAFAPVTDVAARLAPVKRTLAARLSGFEQFLTQSSPMTHAANLKCPLFLFHARDDANVPSSESLRFSQEVQKTNAQVTLVQVPSGGHYDSMIREGIPQAIRWLQGISSAASETARQSNSNPGSNSV